MPFSWILVLVLALVCIIEFIAIRFLNWSLNMYGSFVKQQGESQEWDDFISERIRARLKQHPLHRKRKH